MIVFVFPQIVACSRSTCSSGSLSSKALLYISFHVDCLTLYNFVSIQVVSKPNTLKTSKRFEAEIYVLTKDEGGRHTSFFSNYRPQFYLRTADVTGKVELPENVKMVMPGDNVTATFELISPVPLETGSLFYFFSIFTICK